MKFFVAKIAEIVYSSNEEKSILMTLKLNDISKFGSIRDTIDDSILHLIFNYAHILNISKITKF